MDTHLANLANQLQGELFWDKTMRIMYATDASAYRELPLAVAFPKNAEDLKTLIAFANNHQTSLIPRTAGTSLAGQVVGSGIVVDVSKYFTSILELNKEEHWVKVQPGVIRDELNLYLKDFGLYFGPETSTANRAMIGGMVGNNSCGSNSLIYGSTREHTLEIHALLSDGSEVIFKALTFDEFIAKSELDTLEGKIYKHIKHTLGDYQNQQEIHSNYPKPSIKRRNTGYAIDLLLDSDPFTAGSEAFNFCKLICGSEGTLAFITEIKLHLDLLPTNPSGLLCVHFNTLEDALQANLIALKHSPLVVELMDHYILECTKKNIEQSHNRFFVHGDPAAVLIIEIDGITDADILMKAHQLEQAMRVDGLGYHFPLILGKDKKRVWDLRKAGLGLLSNAPGDSKPVAVIEDTAVDVNDLPEFIADFNEILAKHQLYAVHYAHAATGELHLRPIINLKTTEGNELFRTIALEIAQLVKRYKGSLSGEHGDGRLRGEFIPIMIGDHNYRLLKELKVTWDPKGIFNPGKIVDTPSMNTYLRYEPSQQYPAIKTVFRYGSQNVLQHAEQCNGSGDCRKSHLSGGTMCPSYMATKDEKHTTRARANVLREMLTHSDKGNPFDHEEIKEVMDLCLSCKACKSECPSSVDMAKLKSEFLQAYYDSHGVPFRSRMIAHVDTLTSLMYPVSGLYNTLAKNSVTSGWIKGMLGFSNARQIPLISNVNLRSWFLKKDKPIVNPLNPNKAVYFFCDEFTNYNDVALGQKAILLLEKLGYQVLMIPHAFSGRALISKGLLRAAKKLANRNVSIFSNRLNEGCKLIAVEPSTILSFRDEYIDLVDESLIEDAKRIAPHCLSIEEFIVEEYEKGHISSARFKETTQEILLHGHCQQKALGLLTKVQQALSIPKNFNVQIIPSGCCGMAGSFGYEKEHYDISMKIGELVLFPAVRNKPENSIIAAPGASCRHQIFDGTSEKAKHPIEILFDALN